MEVDDNPDQCRPVQAEAGKQKQETLKDGETFHLIAQAQGGDRQALNRLVERYYPRIRRIVSIRAGSQLRSVAEVDDLVQDVLMRILQGLEKFERRSDALFIHWISRLASRELGTQGIKIARRPRQHGMSDEFANILAEETRSVLSRMHHAEEEEAVDRCLAKLDPKQREILLLREYAGASWAEIAPTLERPSIGACQQYHQRARKALGELLGGGGAGKRD